MKSIALAAAGLCLPLIVSAADHGGFSSRAEKKLYKKCLSGFSIEAAVADKEYHDKNMMRIIEDVRRYYSCEAFTRNNPEFFCKKLNEHWSLPPQRFLADNCIDYYNLYTVARLNITGNPDAKKICETLSISAYYLDGPWGGGTVKEECRLQTTPPGPGCRECFLPGAKPGPACRDVKNPRNPLVFPQGAEDCLMKHVLFGEGDVCHWIPRSNIRNISEQWCRDIVAYRKAYEAGKERVCGQSLPCRMLMGQNVCEGHLEALRRDFCRVLTRRKMGAILPQ